MEENLIIMNIHSREVPIGITSIISK